MEEKIDFEKLRCLMVKEQIEARDIKNKDILEAFLKVSRHMFVPEEYQKYAYEDEPLPIGYGQTISQPYIVALMTDILDVKKGMKVLEIGTGSGYQSAILSELGCIVYSIEKISQLAERAKEILEKLHYNVFVYTINGTLGLEEFAPYQRIIVTAAAPSIPQPLIEQTEEGGKIVIPVGDYFFQELVRGTKKHGKLTTENFGGCQFVPLRGEKGWKE
jgi:protein-L-isoaspartate(D-aspartate) O-methyltransferase